MVDNWAVTWRLGRTNFLTGGVLRPLGSAIAVAQWTEFVPSRKGTRRIIHFAGYGTQIDPDTGVVYFGGTEGNRFYYDFSLRPFVGATKKIIDVGRNASLVALGLEIDRIRFRTALRRFRLKAEVPAVPAIYLGFPADQLPLPEDSTGMRRRLAGHMHRPVAEIDSMDEEERMMLIRAEWGSCFLPPGTDFNTTPLHLIAQPLCSKAKNSLRVYEFFGDLVGAELYNPARFICSPDVRLANPTQNVAKQLNIDIEALLVAAEAGDDTSWMEQEAQLVKGIRQALGADSDLCTADDIAAAIVNSGEKIVPSGVQNPLDVLGEERTLRLMKKAVGRHADCCRDEDLLLAAEDPSRPLIAAGLAPIQVLKGHGAPVVGGSIQIDFRAIKPWWRPEGKQSRHDPTGL
jgi:hypothetical protein